MDMKIALAQLEVEAKQLSANYQKLTAMITDAVAQQADIIVFPALCLSGFAAGHHFLNRDWCQTAADYNELIRQQSADLLIVWGNMELRDDRLVQTAYAAFGQKYLLAGYEKSVEINNRYFKEASYFHNVDNLEGIFTFNDVKMGVSFAAENKVIDCQYQFILDQTPWTRKYNFDSKAYSATNLIYVNACGMQTIDKAVWVLAGGSSYYEDGIEKVSCNNSFDTELQFSDKGKAKNTEVSVLQALMKGIYYFDRQLFSFRPKWIVGLSGGLDSSISAAILVNALGKERVIGYNLATRNNTSATISNAQQLAELLGIELREGSIQADVEATTKTLHNYNYNDKYPGLIYENIQARLRGHILSTFAAIENGLVINNGNKVETALGYCTLYGDTIGALNLLGDLSKVELFALSKEINELYQQEVIPLNLLPEVYDDKLVWQTMPSAELAEGQVDPMKWYYHDYLLEMLLQEGAEKVLEVYLDGSIHKQPLGKYLSYYGLDQPQQFIEDLEWFIKTMQSNQFKRIQSAPGILLSDAIIGVDYPESQGHADYSQRYLELRAKILSSDE